MDWELVKPWVNRVGIVLEFLSFWLVAPEILGEERLRALERRAEWGISRLPYLMLLPVGLVSVWASYQTGSLGLALALVVALLAALASVTAVLSLVLQRAWLDRVSRVSLYLLVVLETVSLAISRRAWYWGAVVLLAWVGASVAGVLLAVTLSNKVIAPLLRALADDKRIRQRSLVVGAVLFVVGFLLQLVATF